MSGLFDLNQFLVVQGILSKCVILFEIDNQTEQEQRRFKKCFQHNELRKG